MTKISPPAHNYSINTLGGEDLTATETGCHLYPAHASKDYFKSFLAQGKISPRNKFKGWVFQMPHHSGKCSVYWKWPNQSYFLGNALPMSPLQHNFSPMEGAEADWPMVHTVLCMQKLSSTLIFTTPVLGMTKGPAVPWWFLTEPPVQGISNLFLPSSCERCCTSTDISHHAANQPERTGHLSCWSLTDQIIETNFRKSQLFPPAPGIVNRTPNPTENNLINKVFIIYRDRMVISVTPSHRFVDVNGQKIPTNSSPEQKCRGQEGEQFHFREG